jgi:hypothetical protein
MSNEVEGRGVRARINAKPREVEMSAITIFLALCIAGVPFLLYVFVSFCRDSKREYRSTCQIVGVRQELLFVETPKESTGAMAEDSCDDGDVAVLVGG